MMTICCSSEPGSSIKGTRYVLGKGAAMGPIVPSPTAWPDKKPVNRAAYSKRKIKGE